MREVDAEDESSLYVTMQQNRLSHWLGTIATLIINFRGLEGLLEYTDPPIKQLVLFVDEAIKAKAEWRDNLLIERIANCELWMIHVSNVTGYWHPLREPYSKFCLRGRPTVWEDDKSHPVPQIVTEWLRLRLKEAKTPA